MVVQATQNDPSMRDVSVEITGSCASADDPFYDGLEFTFQVAFRPEMTGPAVSVAVENFVLPTTVVALLFSGCNAASVWKTCSMRLGNWNAKFGADDMCCHSSISQNMTSVLYCWLQHHQVKSVDGVDAVFQPLSLPTNTEVSILPKLDQDLTCSLTSSRFKPFGYKELTVDPPKDSLDEPVQVSWQIPERFKSLEKIKFLTLSSSGVMLSVFVVCPVYLWWFESRRGGGGGMGLELSPLLPSRRYGSCAAGV